MINYKGVILVRIALLNSSGSTGSRPLGVRAKGLVVGRFWFKRPRGEGMSKASHKSSFGKDTVTVARARYRFYN